MPKVVALHCPHCRAPLPAVTPGQTVVHCDYCNKDTNVAHTQHMPAAGARALAASQAKGKSAGIVLAIMLGLVTVGIVMAFVQMKTKQAGQAGGIASPSGRVLREYFSERHIPLLVDIDADRVEDIVTIVRTVDSVNSKTVVTVYVTTHSGATFKRLWVTKLAGENDYYFRFAVVGAKVVVADDKNTLHVLDLATGAASGKVAVTDRVDEICTVDATHAWIAVTDEATVMLDTAAGTAAPTPRPEACPKREQMNCHSWDTFRDDRPVTAHCVDYSDVAADDMHVSFAIGEGAHAVAVGTRKKGTGFPMLAGFVPGTEKSKPLWVRRVNEDAATAMETTSSPRGIDMALGRIGMIYDAGKENRLQLADAATGSVQWDVTLDDDGITPETLAIRAERVYVPHDDGVSVFDTKTGKLLGRVGSSK